MGRGKIVVAGGLLLLVFLAGFLVGKSGKPEAQAVIENSAAGQGTPGSLIGSNLRSPVANSADNTAVKQIPVPQDRSPESVSVFAQETLEESNRITRMASLMGLLENLTAENWEEVRQAFIDEKQINGRNHHSEWFLFIERAGEVAGEEVMAEMFAKKALTACKSALLGWAKTDPKGAVDWVETVPDPEFRDKIWGSLVIGVAVSDPDLSMRLLEQLPLEDRYAYTPNLMGTILQSAGPDRGAQVFADAVTRAEARGESGGSDYLVRLFKTLANQRITNSKQAGKGEWASQHLGKPYVSDYFITKTAKNIARDNPDEALDWLGREASPEEAAKTFPDLVKDWISFRGNEDLANWLGENPQHPNYDPIAIHFAERLVETDAGAAMHWATTVQDAELRERAIRVIGEANGQ